MRFLAKNEATATLTADNSFLQLLASIYLGERTLIDSILLAAAVQPTVPDTVKWSWTGSAVIIGACLLCLLIIPRIVRYPQTGAKMPLPFSSLFNDPSVGAFLASMSAGHLIGIPAVLGLNNLGILK